MTSHEDRERLLRLLPTGALIAGEMPTSNSLGGISGITVETVNATVARLNSTESQRVGKTHVLMIIVDDEETTPQLPEDRLTLALLLVVEVEGQAELISSRDLEKAKCIVRDQNELPGLHYINHPESMLIKLNPRPYTGPELTGYATPYTGPLPS